MNNIYLGVFLSLFCVCLSYFLLPILVFVTVLSLILAYSFLKDDSPLYQHVATHVAWIYHKTCEIYCNIANMFSKRDSTNIPMREQSQNNGTITNNLDKISLGYRSNSHNLGSPHLLKTSPMNTNSWISNNKVNLRQPYHTSTPQNSLVNFTSPSRTSYKHGSIESNRQYANSSLCVGTSSLSPRKYCSINSQSSDTSSENTPRTYNKTVKPLDARLYANVNSPGFCSRVAEHLNETMTHQPKYDTVGAFPVVHLKSNPSKIKIKTPVRVRLTPRTNDLSYSSVGTNSIRSPLSGTDDSMKSVLQVLKEISRKRIHSNVEEDSEDTTKRLRVNDVQYNNDGVLHATLLQQTIQGKRAREETSPTEDDVKKRRKPLKNNEITSSLSSSLSIKPPHLKTTKRKAPDIDDSISTTPTIGKQLKIQTEVTPPLPRAPVIASECVTNQECEVQTASPNSPRSQSVGDASTLKTQLITEEPKVTLSEATSLSEIDDDKVVSRLLGRMSSPVDDTSALEVPVKKDLFMSTNDLSLSPPKENRLAAMIAVLGGPSENLDGVCTDSETLKQPEKNVAAKALFTSPVTPETPKQHKKVTFANTLTETKVFDTEKCASNENLNIEQTPVTSKPLSINFGLSAFSPSTAGTVKQSLDSNTSLNSEKFTSPSTSPIATPSKTTISSNNSSPKLTFLANSENNKAVPAFSFGATSSPGQINKEKTTPQFSSITKPITFGSESKNPAPTETTAFGSQSIFVKTTVKNESSKSAAPVLNKTVQQFNLFSNEKALANSSKSEVNNTSKEVKNNQLVNGFAQNTVTKSTSPFSFSASVSQASSSKPLFPSLNQQLNGPTQSTTFNFASPSSVAPASSITETVASTVNSQPVQNSFASSASQPSQSNNIFSSAQPSPFSKAANETSQDSTVFKTGNGQISNLFGVKSTNDLNSGSSQSTLFANNAFGTQGNNSKELQNSTIQTNNLFGNSSNNTMPKLSLGSGTSSNQSGLGFSAVTTTTTSQANVGPFGVPANNTASLSSSLFGGLSSTTQSSTIFGNATSSSNTSSQIGSLFSTSTANSTPSSIFSNSDGTQPSKSIFSSSTTAPSFGIQNKLSAPVFTSQNGSSNTNTENPSNFGSQTINSSFGNQNNTSVFSFGNTNPSNVTQSGFGSSGTFNLGTAPSSSSSSEVKPPAFNSSTFMFGSTTTTANKDLAKPFATTAPQFSFGTNSQQTNQSLGNPAQPSVPTFGTSSTGFGTGQQMPSFSAGITQSSVPTFSSSLSQSAAPSFSAGVSQPAPSAFSTGISQPATPAFGAAISQPAAPTFGAGISQSTVPTFGVGMTQSSAPAFGTGISQPAAPAFGAAISQPAAPTFGSGLSQPAAPAFSAGMAQPSTGGFAFGQQATAGPTFQFNATAPQPVQGGMFSIGSGGSSAPRTKIGALRRRHKLT